jgi:hypothetical protein
VDTKTNSSRTFVVVDVPKVFLATVVLNYDVFFSQGTTPTIVEGVKLTGDPNVPSERASFVVNPTNCILGR